MSAQEDNTPSAESAPPRGLELLLGSFDRDKFFNEYWEQRSLHIAHNDPGRYAHLLDSERFLNEEVHHCGFLRASYPQKAKNNWTNEINIQPEQAPDMYTAGMTICASMLREDGPLGRFADEFRQDIYSAGQPHFNVYYSPDGIGASVHFDTHPVWIMQIEGSKHWKVGRKPYVVNPLFNIAYPMHLARVKLPWITVERPNVDDLDEFMHITLHPGDVVYIPPGAWHTARAEGASLAVTLAQTRATAADLLILYLMGHIQQNKEMIERIEGMPAAARGADGVLSKSLEDKLSARLDMFKELVAGMDIAAMRAAYDAVSKTPPQQTHMVPPAQAAEMMQKMYAR